MTGEELEANVAALAEHGLTELFESIADAGRDGIRIARSRVQVLIEARLVRYARGVAQLTEYGWGVSIRIAAHEGARAARSAGFR